MFHICKKGREQIKWFARSTWYINRVNIYFVKKKYYSFNYDFIFYLLEIEKCLKAFLFLVQTGFSMLCNQYIFFHFDIKNLWHSINRILIIFYKLLQILLVMCFSGNLNIFVMYTYQNQPSLNIKFVFFHQFNYKAPNWDKIHSLK